MSTAKQRQDIAYIRKLLGLEDEVYREMLTVYRNCTSSKDLTTYEANNLLNNLRTKAKEIGVFKPYASTKFKQYKYNTLGTRKGMASPAQLRKIEAMWFEVSNQTTDITREKALLAFIKRVTNKDAIEFLTHYDISKLIKALEKMGNKKGE